MHGLQTPNLPSGLPPSLAQNSCYSLLLYEYSYSVLVLVVSSTPHTHMVCRLLLVFQTCCSKKSSKCSRLKQS